MYTDDQIAALYDVLGPWAKADHHHDAGTDHHDHLDNDRGAVPVPAEPRLWRHPGAVR